MPKLKVYIYTTKQSIGVESLNLGIESCIKHIIVAITSSMPPEKTNLRKRQAK
jgi:hypothetical protein